LRISRTVEAATLTPRLASSPWILRYPHSGFSLASRRAKGVDVPAVRAEVCPERKEDLM
jgi:hypothetical protein